jgi:hypothetical protein
MKGHERFVSFHGWRGRCGVVPAEAHEADQKGQGFVSILAE